MSEQGWAEGRSYDIQNNFRGTTMDSYAQQLLYEQVLKALLEAEARGFKKGYELGKIDEKLQERGGTQ